MTANSTVERLTPLDLLMPGTYVSAFLTFQTTESISAVSNPLQSGLNRLVLEMPWLSGRVFPTASSPGHKPSLEIRWKADDPPPSLIDKGSIPGAYETLSARGMLPSDIPSDVWPAPSMIDESLSLSGAPVLAVSLFRFGDHQGMGLCVCMHHNAVDAHGFAEVLRLWTQNIPGPRQGYSHPGDDRLVRLSRELSTNLDDISSVSIDALLTSHPEFSTTPPTLPASFSPCTCRLFSIPIARLSAIKECLGEHLSTIPSTNTVLCALIWSGITFVRKQRNTALAGSASRLAAAVDGRRRVSDDFSTPGHPYFGNAVLYSLARLAVDDLTAFFDSAGEDALAPVCNLIAMSQSPARINSRHIAEVFRLADCVDDYRALSVGWDLFGSRDLTITSWANLDLYDMDFGMPLGKPHFMRIRHAEADGVGVILPRRGASAEIGTSREDMEVMIMLRTDDMDALMQDRTWKTFVQ